MLNIGANWPTYKLDAWVILLLLLFDGWRLFAEKMQLDMKPLFYFMFLLLMFGCSKDTIDPAKQNFGVIEGYLIDNPKIVVIKTNESSVVYTGGLASNRGYIFKPLSPMKITGIGGKIAELGIFRIELYHLAPGQYYVLGTGASPLITDSIKIDHAGKFEFKNISDVTLTANERYLIRYFNRTHNSVYDAGLGNGQSDIINRIKFPLKIRDIEIEVPAYTYLVIYNNAYYVSTEGTFNDGILRGLVDFKYELIQ